jgi:hypothetical protein
VTEGQICEWWLLKLLAPNFRDLDKLTSLSLEIKVFSRMGEGDMIRNLENV